LLGVNESPVAVVPGTWSMSSGGTSVGNRVQMRVRVQVLLGLAEAFPNPSHDQLMEFQ
jgi:hypothetical protein